MKKLTRDNQYSYQSIKLPEIKSVPCLTTVEEQKYLYWLARDCIQDLGAVVEVGTWFGCSAGFLAAGLRDGNHTSNLYCIDRFISQPTDIIKFKEQGFDAHKFDGDVTTIVEEHLKRIYDQVHLIKTDIADMSWDNSPIELLHLDAPKRWSETIKVLGTVTPLLIPGGSVIVVQDFCVPRAYSLPLLFGTLEDYFELVHIPGSSSTMAVFWYKKACTIDSEKLNIFNWDSARVITIFEKISSQFNEEQQKVLKLGLAFYFYDSGDHEMAKLFLNY